MSSGNSKIADSGLEKMIKAEQGGKTVSVILKLVGTNPKIRISSQIVDGKVRHHTSLDEEQPSYSNSLKKLESSLDSIGITGWKSLDAVKHVIIPQATLDQVKDISKLPEVRKIVLNRKHKK